MPEAVRRYVSSAAPCTLMLAKVTLTLNLPAEVAARLEAEASRRGLSVEELIAELVPEPLPEAAADDPLEAFIGSGRSGRGDLGRRYRELDRETEGRAARDL
jgi:hypothetical protein